jgi:hypothetical protein
VFLALSERWKRFELQKEVNADDSHHYVSCRPGARELEAVDDKRPVSKIGGNARQVGGTYDRYHGA